jgi:hypothetical protein
MVAYGVARGDDEGAEEATVLDGLDADAMEDEGVVKVEPRRGGTRDFLRGGGGLEASAHRFRVHGLRRAGLARRMEVTDREGEEEERWEDARIGVEAGGSGDRIRDPTRAVCGLGWIEEEGRGWKEEAGRGERIRQRGARVPPNFIPRKCDWSRRISDGRPQIVGPLGRTSLVSFLLYLIFFLFFFFLLHHCEVAHTNNYLIFTNSFSICNRLYISCLVEISKI